MGVADVEDSKTVDEVHGGLPGREAHGVHGLVADVELDVRSVVCRDLALDVIP